MLKYCCFTKSDLTSFIIKTLVILLPKLCLFVHVIGNIPTYIKSLAIYDIRFSWFFYNFLVNHFMTQFKQMVMSIQKLFTSEEASMLMKVRVQVPRIIALSNP